jgi:GNAT superfamily N-acetyltransferase
MEISKATKEDIPAIREIFSNYQTALNEPVCFTNFEKELDGLLGFYTSPTGFIFLAKTLGNVVGCIAVRPIINEKVPSLTVAELKRFYVYDDFKGMGIGKQLLELALGEAKLLKYRSIMLETMDRMEVATSLYLKTGFKPVLPFYESGDERIIFYQYDIKV